MTELVRLVNSRGVPGTAGPLVRDAHGRFLLCNHHVIFGCGAAVGDCVWALAGDDLGGSSAVLVGHARRSQFGRVSYRGELVFVDCALVEIVAAEDLPVWLRSAVAGSAIPAGVGRAATGHLVCKHGAATGITEGRIADAAYADLQQLDDRTAPAPLQLLVDSVDEQLNFSAPGDSGAALLDDAGRVVGLLWGCNFRGQGIACPIEPVLAALGVLLEATEAS